VDVRVCLRRPERLANRLSSARAWPAPQALRGGVIYSPSPIWMYPVGQTSLQMWQPMHLL
jgi:hypothetical protein